MDDFRPSETIRILLILPQPVFPTDTIASSARRIAAEVLTMVFLILTVFYLLYHQCYCTYASFRQLSKRSVYVLLFILVYVVSLKY